jgi:hypothetical protein
LQIKDFFRQTLPKTGFKSGQKWAKSKENGHKILRKSPNFSNIPSEKWADGHFYACFAHF